MRLIFLSLLLTTLFTGCDKDERTDACEEFLNALKAGDKEKVKEIVGNYIIQSSSLTHTPENLQKLATYISESCDVNATICYGCADTNPPTSKIIISFLDGLTEVTRAIDLSNGHSDNFLKVLGVHGF